MNPISSAGPGVHRASFIPAARMAPAGAAVTSPDRGMRVSLGQGAAQAVVYSDPRVTSHQLADQWRGLGGALLNRFGATGGNYAQTLANGREVALPPEAPGDVSAADEARQSVDVLATQAADLASVAVNAPTAGLRIVTRTGQSVELQISVSAGHHGSVGIKEREAVDATAAAPPAAEGAVGRDVLSLTSGLADFDASFGGATHRSNRFGATKEVGHTDYQLSQATEARDTGRGGRSVSQTVSEASSADRTRANRPDSALDVRNGNHDTTHIRDRRTVTTLIESAAGHRITRALRHTQEQRLETVTELDHHRVVRRQALPAQHSVTTRLA